MRRALLLSLFLPWVCALRLSAACPCMIQFGVCDETRQSDAVFVGTVESVAPPFLDPYARSKAMASLPAAEAARLQADSSPEAFEKLKAVYLQMFTGIPDNVRARIAEAKTRHELQDAFEAVQSEGRFARFRVKTMYKREGEDGKKDDDDATPEFLEIWTGSGECGFDFQVGETYLVYAVEDEGSGKLETSVCMRTRRLSEENGDLAYLYFVQNAVRESTRIEGFVSNSFADQNLPRYENNVTAPLPGALLELDTGSGQRYAKSDNDGHFAFDGLKEGDYRLFLLAAGFPLAPRTVVLSRSFHADEASCSRQILVQPTRPTAPLNQ